MSIFSGKGTYLWNISSLFRGNVSAIVDCLVDARVSTVCAKIHDAAWSKWDNAQMAELQAGCLQHGITFGLYGYIYLYDPAAEAKYARKMIDKYQPAFYVIDAEGQAKGKFSQAQTFANGMAGTSVPVGLASYRYPSLHRELPWKQFRSVCQFDSPQVYYRNGSPSYNLVRSMNEYDAFKPRLPYLPAGDMYSEFGMEPTADAVTEFLSLCRDHEAIDGCLMWVADQKNRVPLLWDAFASFDWDSAGPPPPPPEKALWKGRIVARLGLNKRKEPNVSSARLGVLKFNTVVDVLEVRGDWARIRDGWVAIRYQYGGMYLTLLAEGV